MSGNAILVKPSAAAADELELTILMPCLNEEATVGQCVAQARDFLLRNELTGEVVVVDNGSTDNSVAEAEFAGARVVHESSLGYGSALRTGIERARGRFVIMGDADLSYDFASVSGFVSKLRDGNDLVMGNRFQGGIEPGAMPALHRYVGNPILSFLGRLFFRSQVTDFHCGLRGFRRASILALDLKSTGMEFASEMVVRATLSGHRVTEVPTTLAPAGRRRPPHLHTWRDGWRHLRFLLLFSPRWLFLYPGITLMLVGGILMLWLLPHTRVVGPLGFNVNTMVYAAAALICGFQSISLAVFARTYAAQAGLLPSKSATARMSRVQVEVGLAAGLLLLFGGLVGGVAATGWWGSKSFGALDPLVSLRIVIPSATAMVLGGQVALASFFVGLLCFTGEGQANQGPRPILRQSIPDFPINIGERETNDLVC